MVKPIETIPEGVKHIHCIGIGGSGMFPLVQILASKGYETPLPAAIITKATSSTSNAKWALR